MFTAEVDTTRLNVLMSQFAKETRKGIDEVILIQSKAVLRHLIAVTPPGKRRGNDFLNKKGFIGNQAKKNAEGIIAGDIARLFPTTGIKNEERIRGMIKGGNKWKVYKGKKAVGGFSNNLAALKSHHAQSRNRATGRVNIGRSGQKMLLTRAVIKNQLLKELKGNVGILNAGWRAAFDEIKPPSSSMPAWIKRHGKKAGGVKFRKTKSGLSVTMENRVRYYPKDTAARINQAIKRTERGLEGNLRNMLENKASRINKRMKSRA